MKIQNKLFHAVLYLSLFVFAAGSMIFAPLAGTALAQDAPNRPLVVVIDYSFGDDEYINPGETFTLSMRLQNEGQTAARNLVATFTSGELVPLDTGGVVGLGDVQPGSERSFSQPVTATWDVWGKTVASLPMTLTYTDDSGTVYTGTFDITFRVYTYYTAATATPTPTAAVAVERPQLVIADYSTSIDILEPGLQFMLNLDILNTGATAARSVIMIVGGGSASNPSGEGTPVPGGTSGGEGDFSKFAPLGSSNVQSIGNLEPGESLSAEQPLIVNVSAEPGAYSFRISFSYTDERGRIYNDDQVVTLLVYSIPKLDIDFYMDPGFFTAGQMGSLPLQVINTGKKAAILGNMRVTAEGADIMNNVTLIGYLDAGQYYPLDAMITPYSPGTLELVVTINYTDDFNQPQVITKILTIEVMDAPVIDPEIDPGMNGGEGPYFPPEQTETTWQKILRFLKGLLGLGSEPATVDPGGFPMEGPAVDGGFYEEPLKGP